MGPRPDIDVSPLNHSVARKHSTRPPWALRWRRCGQPSRTGSRTRTRVLPRGPGPGRKGHRVRHCRWNRWTRDENKHENENEANGTGLRKWVKAGVSVRSQVLRPELLAETLGVTSVTVEARPGGRRRRGHLRFGGQPRRVEPRGAEGQGTRELPALGAGVWVGDGGAFESVRRHRFRNPCWKNSQAPMPVGEGVAPRHIFVSKHWRQKENSRSF